MIHTVGAGFIPSAAQKVLAQATSAGSQLVHTPTPFTAFLGTLLGFGGLAVMEDYLQHLCDDSTGKHFAPGINCSNELVAWLDSNALLFVGSFGALSALVFAAPAAPLGKPWNTVCGHIVALAVALVVHSLELPLFWEKILTPAFAVSAMLHLQVVSAPAAACVVFFVTVVDPKYRKPVFILFPALVGIAWMYLVQYFVAVLSRGLALFGTVPQLARSRHANHPGISRSASVQHFSSANSCSNLLASNRSAERSAGMSRFPFNGSWKTLAANQPARDPCMTSPTSSSNLEANSSSGASPSGMSDSPQCGDELFLWRQWHGSGRGPVRS